VAVSRTVRAVLSAVCWVLAVASAILSAAAFAGGGTLCQAGRRTACAPQTWLLVVGIVLALGFGVAGAKLYTPRAKRRTRYPWEYPD
jgi:uncharacterized membrane protein